MNHLRHIAIAALLLACGLAQARLPPPSPAQAQAAAAKKAAADAQAQKDKEALMASMDRIAARWRSQAGAHGRKVNPAVPVAAQAPAPAAPVPRTEKAGTAPPSADIKKQPSRPMPPERKR